MSENPNTVALTWNFYAQQAAMRRAILEDKKRMAFVGSLQVGKSWFLARVLVEQALTNNNPYSDLIACFSPSYKMGRIMVREVEIALREQPRLAKLVKWKRDDPVTATFPNGKFIEFHSLSDPETVRGLRPAFIGVDEGAMITGEAYEILEGRTIQTNAPILITTTPRGKRHWLYRKVFVPGSAPGSKHYNPGEYDPERTFVQVATIFDNPFIDQKNREAVIKSYGGPNSLWAKQELFGEFVDYKGLVFTGFNEDLCVVPDSQVPWNQFEYVTAGVDWGFRDPSVVLVAGLRQGVWWILSEFYESGVDLDVLGAEMQTSRASYAVKRFWGDSAEPARISHYRKMGLPIYPVVKPKIIPRVHYLNSLFQQGRVMVASSCVNTIRELASYHWPEDEGGKDEKTNPVGSDHALDALAYALHSEKNLLVSSQPVFDEPDKFEREWSKSPSGVLIPGKGMTAGWFD